MGPQCLHSSAKTVLLLLLTVSLSGVSRAKAAAIDSEELRPLKCFLQNTPPLPCNEIPVVPELPERLQNMYLNLNDVTKQAVSAGMLEILKPNMISQLPAFFINLMPMNKLSKLDGSSVGAIVRSDPGNLAILRKLSALLTKQKMWVAFIDQMKNVTLPTASQEIIGQMLAQFLPHPNNWTYDRFNEAISVGTPLMAHLPPDFLDNLNKSDSPKFLYHLRNWYWHSMHSTNPWHKNSWSVLRRWARLEVQINYPNILSNWSTQDINSNGFFLDGAMPDELQELTTWQLDKDTTVMNWGRLQARVLFSKIYPSGMLTEEQFLKTLHLIPKLAPTDLQRFHLNVTFKQLTYTKEMSFITAKQVVETLIAEAVAKGHMPSDDPAQWKDSISNLGSFVFALPPHYLKPYLSFQLHSALPDIDSLQLSPTQARYLTNSYVKLRVPETILSLSGNLLHALDSKSVALAVVGEMPHRVRLHLLATIPPGARVRSLAVLQKVRNSLGDVTVLESMLTNRNPEQFFSLLLPKEVARAASQISQALSQLAEEGYAQTIKRLPHNVLSPLLSVARQKVESSGEGWTEDNLLRSPSLLFLLGLTCSDVDALESTDVVAVLEKYNRERLAVGQEFPKQLQHCAQSAVIRYLRTKANLNGVSYTGAKLFDHLDVSEIMAIGGYVLASLPVKVISPMQHASDMLQAIGALSLPEILVATSGNAKEFTNLFVKELIEPNDGKLTLVHLLSLGNLIHFLRASDVDKVHPPAFRQLLELQDGRGLWVTMCSSLKARTRWGHIIKAAFGPIENWTAGVLATLSDFLAVLPVEELDSVPDSSWEAAADTLVQNTRYHVQLQWPGEVKPLMLFEVCGKLTDEAYPSAVKGLARRYLLAVHALLKTVRPARHLLHYSRSNNTVETELELAPLNKPPITRRVLNQSESPKKDAESDGIETQENLFLNAVTATVPAFERSKRSVENTQDGKKQYGDVLRSKVTGGRAGTDASMLKETPSPTTYSEVHSSSTKVSCEAVRASGPVAGLGLSITDVDSMSSQELEDCVDVLGALSLSTVFKQQVWTLIRHNNLSVHLADLGGLLAGLSVEDVQGINLDQKGAGALDTLAALSSTVADNEVLEKLVQLFTDANLSAPHPSLGVETILALGKVACFLPITFLRRIARSNEVFYASAALAEMDTCDGLCLREFARQMLHEQALGPIANWTSEDVRSLGVLAAGISAETWSTVKQRGNDSLLSGLQPSAIKCMETETLKAFSTAQLESLNPMAVAAISPAQMAALWDSQRLALKQTKAMDPKSLDFVIGHSASSSVAVNFGVVVYTLIAVLVLV